MSRDIEIKAKLNAKGVEEGLERIADGAKDLGKETAQASKDADKLGEALNKLASQAQSSAGGLAGAVAQGKLMADMAEQIGAKIGEAINAMISLGTQTEQLIARFGAMKNNLTSAKEAYQAFNDVGRNTNYNMDAIYTMGMQLMNLGYNAQQAAEMIEIVSDTAAGLGKGQEGAQALMDSLNRMRSTGMFTIREMKALQEQGIHVEKALADAFGVDTQQAIEMVKDNTIDGKDAFEILTNYIKGEFAGSMTAAKNNISDAWGDVAGNVQTAMGEIGGSIAEAFNQSGIVQDMINITQDFVDLVRSDGVGVFSDLKEVASFVLEEIAGLLKIVWQGLKAVILMASDMYSAFRSIGSQIADALSPILKPLGAIYKAVSGIIGTLGGSISEGIDASWANKFGGGYYDPTDTYGATNALSYKGNGNYRAGGKNGSTGSTGGSGGGSGANPMAEYTRQLQKIQGDYSFNEKLIKTQQDAYKKVTDAANASALASLSGEAKKQKEFELTQEALIKAQNLDNAATERKIANYEAQVNVYKKAMEAGVAPDGTAEKIALLEEQAAQEKKLLKVRQDMTQMQLEANAELNKNGANGSEKWIQKEKELWEGYAMSVAASISDAVGSVLDGNMTIGQALAQMAKTLIKNALTMLTQWLALVAILAAFGDPTPGRHASVMMFGVGDKYTADPTTKGGLIPKAATGGLITGPGSGTSDTAGLFALSNGEYVLRADAVSRLGVPFLDGINSGNYSGFAGGGIVASHSVSNSDSSMKAASSSLTLNISALDASGFGDFLNRGGLNAIKQALQDDDRLFNSAAGVW